MVTIVKWDGPIARECEDALAIEEPLEIRVRGRAISVTMRTPGSDADLAAGFLLTEGIIHDARDILRIEHCGRNEDDNVINVLLAPHVRVDFDKLTRHVFASSSCGLCGKATIDAVRWQFPSVQDNNFRIHAAIIATLPQKMRAAQESFDATGGLHAAALFDPAGRMIVLREDVGRHNAVDKVIGYGVMNSIDMSRCVLLVSGRSSFEIMQKALAARISIVAAVSAPSSLAVSFARESGQTLIGFLRDQRMNIYAGGSRCAM